MYDEKELFLIWLDSFIGIEYKHKFKLHEAYGGGKFSAAALKNADYLRKNAGEGAFNTLINADNKEYIDFVLGGLEKRNIAAVTLVSELYPEELKEAPCPPLVLYAKGNTELLKTDKFAIVGSRKSLPFAIAKAEEFTEKLISAGLTVVTGIAEGVDEAVVKAGLKSGKVISVVAGGFDRIYPAKNAGLFAKTAENALVLSEYPPEVPTERYHFPVRNRIIAGLGKGALIVSGGMKSGTFYTAEYADEMSRQVFAFPYSINVASGEGCNNLIKHGAFLTDCVEDILGFYGLKIPEEKAVILTDVEKSVYDIITEKEIHIDKLCAATGKKAYELAPVLSMLEIKKLIVKLGGNRYSRI